MFAIEDCIFYTILCSLTWVSESYGFNVANFDVEFQDNTQISLGGIPTSDEDGLKKSKEFTFTAGEQAFYKEKGLTNEPKRCKECRDKRKAERQSYKKEN